MAKWARIQDSKCAEFTEIDPEGRFHPDVVWLQVPDKFVETVNAEYFVTEGVLTTTPQYLYEQLRGKLSVVKWMHIVKGVYFNGEVFATDKDSLQLTSTSGDRAERKQVSTRFKTASGDFVTLAWQDAVALRDLVQDYTNDCFAREDEITELLKLARDEANGVDTLLTTYASLIAIDWPSNGEVTQ
jgi:hypothetical protein